MDYWKLFWFVVWYYWIVLFDNDVVKYYQLFYIGVSYEVEDTN